VVGCGCVCVFGGGVTHQGFGEPVSILFVRAADACAEQLSCMLTLGVTSQQSCTSV
jgi:hypothetical protein